jgi:NAD(P)-dependent dehydrogenase (short-subunit alcohol dehydrogenase family)
MMKIAVIGATGTIGKAVVAELSARHEVIQIGRASSQYQLDITIGESIHALFSRLGPVDSLVVTTGNVHFGPLTGMTADQFKIGLHDKLLGQVYVALIGQHHLTAGGSVTLTTGILNEEPILGGANAASVNAAIEGFVRASAIEMPRSIRINAVSPTVLQKSLETYGPFFRGFEPVPASRVALAYSRSIEGAQTGKIYRIW